MKKPVLTKTELSNMFNVPVERLNEQYADNAAHMRKQEAKARRTGKKVDGLNADEWAEKAAEFERLAAS